MKIQFYCILFLVFFLPVIGKAQDTIFLKSGIVIPAVIVEKGAMEIKYKKFGQPEPAGIYSVFASDVARIKYKNGTVVENTTRQAVQEAPGSKAALEMKLSIGPCISYFNRNTADNLLLFWRNWNNDQQLAIGGNHNLYSMTLDFGGALGGTKRNWFGTILQLAFTPSDAIYASNIQNGLQNKIKLQNFYYNIKVYYGHTINHKKTIVPLIETGIDLGMMNGTITWQGVAYKESSISKICPHLATGVNWIISKRLLASVRAGLQFMSIDETHEDKKSSTNFATFYANPPGNTELVKVKWSGSYASFGLAYTLNVHPNSRHKK